MIVDTSAIVAILTNEPEAAQFAAAIAAAPRVAMSAASEACSAAALPAII